MVEGAKDVALGGVCGRSVRSIRGRADDLGRAEVSSVVPTRMGDGARPRVLEMPFSMFCSWNPLALLNSRSGLVLPPSLDDFPAWKASRSFRPGDIPRKELLMLFLRPGPASPTVFDRSGKEGESRLGVELVEGSSAGKVGE